MHAEHLFVIPLQQTIALDENHDTWSRYALKVFMFARLLLFSCQ